MDYKTYLGFATPIANNCLKLSIEFPSNQSFSKIVTASVCSRTSQYHDFLPEKGGIREARDADKNIIIIDSTMHTIMKPQLKMMY